MCPLQDCCVGGIFYLHLAKKENTAATIFDKLRFDARHNALTLSFDAGFGVLVKQVLYFDRYTRLLAPELDVTQDQRLSVLNAQSDALNDAVDCMDI